MKKLLFVALIGTFVACGEATTTTEPTDTEVVTPEAPIDTMVAPVDTIMAPVDTTVAPK
jgi:hypothetical protein